MKKKSIVTACLAVSLSLLLAVQARAQPIEPEVNLDVLDSYIQVGESFDVMVQVDGEGIGEDLLAFAFALDDSLFGGYFSYMGYVLNSDFNNDMPYFTADVAGSAFPGIADDDVLLATLSFSALNDGTGKLRIAGKVDPDNLGLYYASSFFDIFTEIDIPVNPATAPIPEPTTMLLLGSGLATLAGIRRRNRTM